MRIFLFLSTFYFLISNFIFISLLSNVGFEKLNSYKQSVTETYTNEFTFVSPKLNGSGVPIRSLIALLEWARPILKLRTFIFNADVVVVVDAQIAIQFEIKTAKLTCLTVYPRF